MRPVTLVFIIAALALAPTAMGLENAEVTYSADMPSEVEVGAPSQTFDVDGQEVTVDSTEATEADSPAGVLSTVKLNEFEVDAQGPQCKLQADKLKNQDEAQRQCSTGSVTTNAGLDTVELDVALTLGPKTAAASEDDAGLGTQSAALLAVPVSATMLLAVAAAGASAGVLYGIWRILKWTGIAAMIPLYSHITDDQILDDPNRASIYRLIQAEAGISTKDIADRLDLAWGTVTHHLTKLEKRRFVVSKKYGKYRRFFANGSGGTERKDEVAVLRLDRTGDIAQLIRSQPGLTQKQVSDILGVSSSTILWHVKRLEQVDLVNKVRDGKQVRYYPNAALENASLITPASA